MKFAAVLLLALVAVARADIPLPSEYGELPPEYVEEPAYPEPEPYQPYPEPTYTPEPTETPYGKNKWKKQKLNFFLDTEPLFDQERMYDWAEGMLEQVNTKVLAQNASLLESQAAPWNKKVKDFDFPVDLGLALLVKGEILDDDYDKLGNFRGTLTFGVIDVLLELYLGDFEKETDIIVVLTLDFGKGNTIALNGSFKLTFNGTNGRMYATKINIAVIGGTGKFLGAAGQTLLKYLDFSKYPIISGANIPFSVGIITPNLY